MKSCVLKIILIAIAIIAIRANIVPNNNNNGRSGSFCGCFRRR